MTVKIFVGDCKDVLKSLPAKSVHCCVTSPPYWGLRDYGLPPSVWGGDMGCRHEWGNRLLNRQRGKVDDHSTLAGGDGRLQDVGQGQFWGLDLGHPEVG